MSIVQIPSRNPNASIRPSRDHVADQVSDGVRNPPIPSPVTGSSSATPEASDRDEAIVDRWRDRGIRPRAQAGRPGMQPRLSTLQTRPLAAARCAKTSGRGHDRRRARGTAIGGALEIAATLARSSSGAAVGARSSSQSRRSRSFIGCSPRHPGGAVRRARAQRIVQAGLDRARAHAGSIRDLVDRQVLVEPQDDSDPVVGAEAGEGSIERVADGRLRRVIIAGAPGCERRADVDDDGPSGPAGAFRQVLTRIRPNQASNREASRGTASHAMPRRTRRASRPGRPPGRRGSPSRRGTRHRGAARRTHRTSPPDPRRPRR